MSKRPKALVLMPRITFDGQFLPEQLDRLHALCDVIDPCPAGTLDAVLDNPAAAAAEILITGWRAPYLSSDFRPQFPKLSLIAHAAGSVKHFVDIGWLAKGVRITTCAAANARPVAEFTLAHILLWNKDNFGWVRRYRDQRDRLDRANRFAQDHLGNREKTIGIVGASRVGRHLIELLRPFDLDVVVYDPYVSERTAVGYGARKVSLEELLQISEIVSVNAPSLPDTEGMIGAEQLALMRDGALLINTARGKLIDHDALIEQLHTGRISAVLDVTDPEPLPADSPLYDMENVVLTPHIAGSLGKEIHRMTDMLLSEIDLYAREGRLEHELVAEKWSSAA
ncbi:hydroxyacid dehydrogenase [Bauldia sp.]|uniref:hydroxyacid dehydrogenase n=1 Tax=Bauldia sp. TaxID=2575872 RepID=UPI003BAB3723